MGCKSFPRKKIPFSLAGRRPAFPGSHARAPLTSSAGPRIMVTVSILPEMGCRFMNSPVIRLRAFEPEDLPSLHRWLNDPDAIRYVGRIPRSLEDTVRHVERKKANGDLLMAVETAGGHLAGWVFLQNIEYEHGRAGIGILLAPEFRGQGVGEQAMRQMLRLAFRQLRLNRVYLTTRGFNDRAIRLYRKLGFVVEGTLRRHAFVDGRYSDTLYMGLLAEEFEDGE